MINSKTYTHAKVKVNYKKLHNCNAWFNKDKRLIAMNFYGDKNKDVECPRVHWLFDETNEWPHESETTLHRSVRKIQIVSHN